ncbi:hypothetical protein MES4922_160128 [Mesorhizobium ventifaucium]|uniref:Secreted protein n=1 Tax=Mesorhizobium ventifaucium TaxID=666020 RepID=A0ABN8JGX5_9HYPH|nr:hypothetical protein MES4922_160128 [Mesorhizobium ventifaucium]
MPLSCCVGSSAPRTMHTVFAGSATIPLASTALWKRNWPELWLWQTKARRTWMMAAAGVNTVARKPTLPTHFVLAKNTGYLL